jgi:hypothetical protein
MRTALMQAHELDGVPLLVGPLEELDPGSPGLAPAGRTRQRERDTGAAITLTDYCVQPMKAICVADLMIGQPSAGPWPPRFVAMLTWSLEVILLLPTVIGPAQVLLAALTTPPE